MGDRKALICRMVAGVSAGTLVVLGLYFMMQSIQTHQLFSGIEPLVDSMRVEAAQNSELQPYFRTLDYVYRQAIETQNALHKRTQYVAWGILIVLILSGWGWTHFRPMTLTRPRVENRHKQFKAWRITCFVLGGIVVMILLPKPWKKENVLHENMPGRVGATLEALSPEPDREHRDSEMLVSALEQQQTQWPLFRGSVWLNDNEPPLTANLVQKWRVPIPLPGFNSPVVWDNRIFVSGATAHEQAIMAFERQTGRCLWRCQARPTSWRPRVQDDTGYAAPTCAVNASHVYAIFATGQLVCATHDGQKVWEKEITLPEIMYGYASSLLLVGDRLFVQCDGENEQSLYAFNGKTGVIQWHQKYHTSSSWSSPVLSIDSRGENGVILTTSNSHALALDVQTGAVIWRQKCMGGEVACSAFAQNGRFYFSNTGAITAAINGQTGEIIWQNNNVPAPDVASCAVSEGVMYILDSGGSLIALDCQTGNELYEEAFDEGFYASPVVFKNQHLLAVNRQGTMVCWKNNPHRFDKIWAFKLNEEVVATPAVMAKMIIIRTAQGELLALEEK